MITLGAILAVALIAAVVVAWASKSPPVAPTAGAPVAPETAAQRRASGLPVVEVKVLAFESMVTEHWLSQGVIEVHHGDVPAEKLRDLPMDEDQDDKDFVHATRGYFCTVGDLIREPERYGVKPGEPVRYWSPLSTPGSANPWEQVTSKMGLFELVP